MKNEFNLRLDQLSKEKTYILGCSGGADSVSLAYLLKSNGFDHIQICHVNYGVRDESKAETAYVKKLSKELFSREAMVLEVNAMHLSNFEHNARKIRYDFFKSVYETVMRTDCIGGLLLGHNLNDRMEWMLLQIAKGSGLGTISGFDYCSEVYGMDVYRPLMDITKENIYAYCQEKNIKYFEDSSNQDSKYKRNAYRPFVKEFLAKNEDGVRNTLSYLSKEKREFLEDIDILEYGPNSYSSNRDYTYYFKKDNDLVTLHQISNILKSKLNYVPSNKTLKEIKKSNFNIEVTVQMKGTYVRKIAIVSTSRYVYICDYRHFKESRKTCDTEKEYNRLLKSHKVPKKLRVALVTKYANNGKFRLNEKEFLKTFE